MKVFSTDQTAGMLLPNRVLRKLKLNIINSNSEVQEARFLITYICFIQLLQKAGISTILTGCKNRKTTIYNVPYKKE